MMTEEQLFTSKQMYGAALEKLQAAEELCHLGYFKDSLSRSYYSAFHMVSLLLYLDGKTFSKHSQLLGSFNKDYVATGRISAEISKLLGFLFDERQSADYDVFLTSTRSEAQQGLESAWSVIKTLGDHIQKHFHVTLQSTSTTGD